MIVYHCTDAAEQILARGFHDSEGTYLTRNVYTGVWVADRPLDVNDGVDGDRVLAIEIPESVIASFEWIEEEEPYREWLVPAQVLNEYPLTEVLDF